MRKPFVGKQVLQQVGESSLFGKHRADLHECLLEADEAEEPDAVKPDRF